MKTKYLSLILGTTLLLSSASSAFANPAQSITVKIGYVNLQLIKASYPEAAGSESLRIQAENQLRRDVEEGNRRLQKMQEDKKPKEEVEKAARDMQIEINAKQQALIQLVQTQNAIATQAIASAVQAIAKDKSLDVVVDGAAVFAGGDKIVNSGEDITEAVVRKLQPQTLSPTSSDTSKPAPAAPATIKPAGR